MNNRRGFTLVEILAVLVILVVLGALVAPSLRLLERDTKVLGAADTLRAKIAAARGEAMEHGRLYRLALSEDGRRVRVAPDDQAFGTVAQTTDEAVPLVVEDELPKGVTAKSEPADGSAPTIDADGWVRVATFQQDGTCREDAVLIRITQPTIYPVVIRIRGLTGAATIQAQKPGVSR